MTNMDPRRLKRLSKRMSWALRHGAADVGLPMDKAGYVALPDLMGYLSEHFPQMQPQDVVAVVETVEPEKRRFTIHDERIRANYGHSLVESVSHEEMMPPSILYHGTCAAALVGIFSDGLIPMGRQYVHLTTDLALAQRVGARHGKAVVLQVDTGMASLAGVRFYQANPAFWLAERIPRACLTQVPERA